MYNKQMNFQPTQILSSQLYGFYLLLASRWGISLCKCFESPKLHECGCESFWLKSILKVEHVSSAAGVAFISCSSPTQWESKAMTCDLAEHYQEHSK